MQSKLSNTVLIDLPSSQVMSICQQAIIDLQWKLISSTLTSISCKENISLTSLFAWPAYIDIFVQTKSDNESLVQFNGSVAGFGPIQKNHLKGQMEKLSGRIEQILSQSSAGSEQTSNDGIGTELTKLASLRDQGILTDHEFEVAKSRLLNAI